MGRGRSGASKAGGGGGGGVKLQAAGGGTPSGVTLDQFRQMDEATQVSTMNQILNDPSIKVPAYLDGSDTSKLMYALGMDNKPTVVDDSTLDGLPGRELFRTVYETRGTMPPPSSTDITDQIRHGDYTQMSGSGGSAYGRGLYFASSFRASALYGSGEQNPTIMRAKLNPNAKMASYRSLQSAYTNSNFPWRGHDGIALFAIAKGYDGWYDSSSGYNILLNRSALTASSKNKNIYTAGKRSNGLETSWAYAVDKR